MIKRLITEEQKSKLKDEKRYKGKKVSSLTQEEKNDLLKIIAEKLNLL